MNGRVRALVLLLLTPLFLGCNNGGGPATVAPGTNDPRPAEAPDILLLTVSGRTLDIFDAFCPPECNEAYLGEPGAAGEAVELALIATGRTVLREDYIASLKSFDDDGDGAADRLGYLDLLATLDAAFADWIAGRSDPTRIVIVAHSHGAVWAHAATSMRPDVPIEALVSLDGVCIRWEDDHEDPIRDFYAEQGGNPFPWDLSEACEQWTIPGVGGAADTEDVTFPSVLLNIEARADAGDFPFFADEQDNHRLDGGEEGIERFDSTDSHSLIDEPGRETLLFVNARLQTLFGPG